MSHAICSHLILGTMPSRASLQANQYYANPRNQFWKIMGRLLDFDDAMPYAGRLTKLCDHNIALWDVLASCIRASSLDAHIQPDTIKANDFTGFLRTHSKITTIFFNGRTAERYFRRYVVPQLALPATIHLIGLPSTSPAYAAMSWDGKFSAWHSAFMVTKGLKEPSKI